MVVEAGGALATSAETRLDAGSLAPKENLAGEDVGDGRNCPIDVVLSEVEIEDGAHDARTVGQHKDAGIPQSLAERPRVEPAREAALRTSLGQLEAHDVGLDGRRIEHDPFDVGDLGREPLREVVGAREDRSMPITLPSIPP